jgi:hypothetical protein
MQLSHLLVALIGLAGLAAASPTPVNDASSDALPILPFDAKLHDASALSKRVDLTIGSGYPPGYIGLGSEYGWEWTANALDTCQEVRHVYHHVRKLFQAQGTVCTQVS